MERDVRRPRRAALLATVTVAAGIGLAGCGTRPYGQADASRPGLTGGAHVPQAGGRTSAQLLARRLLARAPLPAGAVPLRGRPPEELRRPVSVEASGDSVLLHRFWRGSLSLAAAGRYLAAHVPGGMEQDATSTSGTVPPWLRGPVAGRPPRIPDRYVTLRSVTYRLRHAVPGVFDAVLTVAAAAARGGGSVLRADAQVVWYPLRSAAEYVHHGRQRVVIVSVGLLNPRPHVVTRVLRSGTVIARLARPLNGMNAIPPLAFGCPAITAAYRVEFAPSPAARPYLVADDIGCGGVTIVTGCGPAKLWAPAPAPAPALAPAPGGCDRQPALADPAGRLITALARLVGVPPRA